MEAGLPIVSYDCGGQTDFLHDDFSRLVPVGDLDSFQARLRELLACPARRVRMGEAARNAVGEYYVERFADRYVDLYRDWEKPGKAAEWQKKLDDANSQEKTGTDQE